MSDTKKSTTQQPIVQSTGYSKEYNTIRIEAESKWPAWKVTTYNANFATSAHAKKVNVK